jgi:FkbM family methyltransferase
MPSPRRAVRRQWSDLHQHQSKSQCARRAGLLFVAAGSIFLLISLKEWAELILTPLWLDDIQGDSINQEPGGKPAPVTARKEPVSNQKSTTSKVTRVVPDFIKRSEGEKWRVWDKDRDGVLFREQLQNTTSCDWAKFRPVAMPGLPPPTLSEVSMCIYEGTSNDQWVSQSIRSTGNWGECNALSTFAYNNGNELHLEVGANIGSCVLQVLLTTNAKIVAFEPAPSNLFCLTSTLSALPPNLRDRVFLFPIGAGDAPIQSTIHVARDNRGNSVIGREIRDFPSQEFLPPMPISVERIDSVLDVTKLPLRNSEKPGGGVSSMKIDVQGYECSVVRGMLPLFLPTAVHSVKFENDPNFLGSSGSGCSHTILFDLFTKPTDSGGAGFFVFELTGGDTVKLPALLTALSDRVDLVALPRANVSAI